MTKLKRMRRRGETLRWNLVENAVDFVQEALEIYFYRPVPRCKDNLPGDRSFPSPEEAPSDDRAYKYSILHLHAGILLVLKERLLRIDERLVFQDPKKPQGKDGEIRTVYLGEALKRLRQKQVPIDEAECRQLRKLGILRNRIEHYELHLERKAAQGVITKNVEFVYHFLRKELNVDLREELSPRSWRMVEQLRGVADRLREEWLQEKGVFIEKVKNLSVEEVLQILEDSDDPPNACVPHWDCHWCGSGTVVFWERAWVCTNPECREVFDGVHCIDCDDFLPDFSDFSDFDSERCPACEEQRCDLDDDDFDDFLVDDLDHEHWAEESTS